jgi:hypothetical protein
VDRLTKESQKSGVPVWLDRHDIAPGTRWRVATCNPKRNFFYRMFFREYYERDKTYMSEEISITIDELRLRPSDRTLVHSDLLNKTHIPSRPISSVEDLGDINAINLYQDWNVGIERLLRVLLSGDPVNARIWHLLEMCDFPFPDECLYAITQSSKFETVPKPD